MPAGQPDAADAAPLHRRTENTAPGVDAAAAVYKRKVAALSAAAAVILPCSLGRTAKVGPRLREPPLRPRDNCRPAPLLGQGFWGRRSVAVLLSERPRGENLSECIRRGIFSARFFLPSSIG